METWMKEGLRLSAISVVLTILLYLFRSFEYAVLLSVFTWIPSIILNPYGIYMGASFFKTSSFHILSAIFYFLLGSLIGSVEERFKSKR